jgi:hypothetical protein
MLEHRRYFQKSAPRLPNQESCLGSFIWIQLAISKVTHTEHQLEKWLVEANQAGRGIFSYKTDEIPR